MTLQNTLPITVEERRFRIVRLYRGRRINVSGLLSERKAQRRLSRISQINVHDTYELEPVMVKIPGGRYV